MNIFSNTFDRENKTEYFHWKSKKKIIKIFVSYTLRDFCMNIFSNVFTNMHLGANVIKLFTMVNYHNAIVIPSFCIIKLHYLGNYNGMALNYNGKMFYNIGPSWRTKYCGNYLQNLTLENVVTAVIWHGIFIILDCIVRKPKVRNNICWNAFIQWCRLSKSISFYIKWG